MIITADTKETAEKIKQMLTEFIRERGLELSEEKTLITHILDGFSFLGWTFRKFGDKFKAQPSKGSVQSIVDKLHKILRKGRSWAQDGIIREINSILRGWSNYHTIVSTSRTFLKIDNTIFNMCYAWAKRRHPKESRTKVVRKYWHQKGSRKWVFSTESQELISLSKVKYRPYCMVQLDKNPYIDINYFEKRNQKTIPRR
jgi:RNA-directed DNA polymerase